MASKSSKTAVKKYSNSEKKVRRALALLDSAVQEWYAEHNPNNKQHYATVHIADYPDDNIHASRVTMNSDVEGSVFVDLISSKQRGL